MPFFNVRNLRTPMALLAVGTSLVMAATPASAKGDTDFSCQVTEVRMWHACRGEEQTIAPGEQVLLALRGPSGNVAKFRVMDSAGRVLADPGTRMPIAVGFRQFWVNRTSSPVAIQVEADTEVQKNVRLAGTVRVR